MGLWRDRQNYVYRGSHHLWLVPLPTCRYHRSYETEPLGLSLFIFQFLLLVVSEKPLRKDKVYCLIRPGMLPSVYTQMLSHSNCSLESREDNPQCFLHLVPLWFFYFTLRCRVWTFPIIRCWGHLFCKFSSAFFAVEISSQCDSLFMQIL